MDLQKAIIIDNGTGTIKAGQSGEHAPRVCFPTVVGHVLDKSLFGEDFPDDLIGWPVIQKKSIISETKPIKDGQIRDWAVMMKVWFYTIYEELKTDPCSFPLLITDSVNSRRGDREKMCQVFFETFNVPFFYVINQNLLSMYSNGKTTGVLIQAGEGVINSASIYQGILIAPTIEVMGINGEVMTNHVLQKLKAPRDYYYSKMVKEKFCYLSNQFEIDYKKLKEQEGALTLPDGT